MSQEKKPFRPLPSGDFTREDVLALVDAANGARLTLHAELLGASERDDDSAPEILGETLGDLQTALRALYGDEPLPPICSGCSPLTIERHGFNESYVREPGA